MMNKLTSVILLLICLNASFCSFLRQDKSVEIGNTSISPEIIDEFVNKLDSKINQNNMNGQIQQLEDKLETMVNDMKSFQVSLANIKSNEQQMEQSFQESKEKFAQIFKQRQLESSAANMKFVQESEPVEAQEIVQDPNAKVQIDGNLDFQFNVPIAKYSSETSEIVSHNPKPTPVQQKPVANQTQVPRQQQQQIQQQQAVAPRQVIQQQAMQQQAQQQQQQQQYQYGGYAVNNQFIPQQQYAAPMYGQQQMMMNPEMFQQDDVMDMDEYAGEYRFAEIEKRKSGKKGVDFKKTQWVGSDEWVQKAKRDQDLKELTQKELRNGAGNNMAYHYPRRYDQDTMTPQVTSVNIDMF